MDSDGITRPEIQIEAESSPFWFQVCMSAAAVFYLVWEGTGFFLKTDTHSAGEYGTLLFALFVACWIIFKYFITSDVRWTIRSDDIRIDQNWIIFDRRKVVFVKRGEVTKIRIASVSGQGEGPDRFYIRLWLTSGEDIESPPISNARRSRELEVEIMKRLNMAHEDVTPRT